MEEIWGLSPNPGACPQKIAAVTHAYPDRTIHLTLIDCKLAAGFELTALEHSALGRFTSEEMKGIDFCAAYAELVPVLFADA